MVHVHLAGGKNGVVCVGTWDHHEGEVLPLSVSLSLPLFPAVSHCLGIGCGLSSGCDLE